MLARSDVRRSLEQIVGPEFVIDSQSSDDVDWTGRFVGEPTFIVCPESVDEVGAVVQWARRTGTALVPRGGNTGLVGGSIATNGSILLSTRRLRAVGPVDRLTRQITVGAGVTLQEVHEAVAPHGLRHPVDFGARGSATIGGTAATNAGGINVVRYGMTRRRVVGIEAVLGDGSVVSHLGGLVKDNTGYDLVGLLCGSEGTLGVVTAVRLQLVPRLPQVVTALVSCDDVRTAVRLTADVCARLESVDAAELVMSEGVDLIRASGDFAIPVPDRRVHVLIECSDTADQSESLSSILDSFEGIDVSVAVTPAQRANLWRIRDEQTPSINRLGVPFKFDVTVPVSELADFIERIPDSIDEVRPGSRTFVFGHVADGNMHVNVVGGRGDDDLLTERVLTEVVRSGGSISAEHGIGRAKREWLHLSRSSSEIDAMSAIKRALDPDGVMNPGVVLP